MIARYLPESQDRPSQLHEYDATRDCLLPDPLFICGSTAQQAHVSHSRLKFDIITRYHLEFEAPVICLWWLGCRIIGRECDARSNRIHWMNCEGRQFAFWAMANSREIPNFQWKSSEMSGFYVQGIVRRRWTLAGARAKI
jgi:hypothetical protein